MSFRTQFDQFEDYRGIEKYSEGDEEQYTYAYIYNCIINPSNIGYL